MPEPRFSNGSVQFCFVDSPLASTRTEVLTRPVRPLPEGLKSRLADRQTRRCLPNADHLDAADAHSTHDRDRARRPHGARGLQRNATERWQASMSRHRSPRHTPDATVHAEEPGRMSTACSKGTNVAPEARTPGRTEQRIGAPERWPRSNQAETVPDGRRCARSRTPIAHSDLSEGIHKTCDARGAASLRTEQTESPIRLAEREKQPAGPRPAGSALLLSDLSGGGAAPLLRGDGWNRSTARS